jgi:hypothetical protein
VTIIQGLVDVDHDITGIHGSILWLGRNRCVGTSTFSPGTAKHKQRMF